MAALLNPPSTQSLTIGGRTFTDLANLKVLTGYINAAGAGNSSFRLPGATAGYQVPVGKSFRIQAVRFLTSTDGPSALCYSDNDLGFASATAPTNQVFLNGNSTASQPILTKPTATPAEVSYDFTIPTGKYIGLTNSAGATVAVAAIYGYEV